jgi:redox-sensitive bicupin YhaK (pirin superfamily)
MTPRTIAQTLALPYHAFDAHSGAHMLRAAPEHISPFIGADSYTMPQPFFGPHPHAGMSAVTLMLPEADGGFVNRDSLGDRSLIRPGDLHWTQAGRGMMHEEVPAEPGRAARGMQVFVNLARKHKPAEPVAFHVERERMPTVPLHGGQAGPAGSLRVVAGEFAGHRSPIADDARWLTRVNMLDVTVHATATVPIPATHNAFFVLRSGSLVVHGTLWTEPVALITARDGEALVLTAGEQPARGVLFTGEPIDEPLFPGGPFMGNDADDIAAYKRAFAGGHMGQLSKSF